MHYIFPRLLLECFETDSIGDIDNALECLADLRVYYKTLDIFYDQAIARVMEVKSERECSDFASLLLTLVQQDQDQINSLVGAMERFIGQLEDVLLDFPKALDLVARFLAPSLSANEPLLSRILQIRVIERFPQLLKKKFISSLLQKMTKESLQSAQASLAVALQPLQHHVSDVSSFPEKVQLRGLTNALMCDYLTVCNF